MLTKNMKFNISKIANIKILKMLNIKISMNSRREYLQLEMFSLMVLTDFMQEIEIIGIQMPSMKLLTNRLEEIIPTEITESTRVAK